MHIDAKLVYNTFWLLRSEVMYQWNAPKNTLAPPVFEGEDDEISLPNESVASDDSEDVVGDASSCPYGFDDLKQSQEDQGMLSYRRRKLPVAKCGTH